MSNCYRTLRNILPAMWRRRSILFVAVLTTSAAAFLYHVFVGERYEVYTILRVGQGIKDRTNAANLPLGDGVDLISRLNSLAKIGETDHVISQAAIQIGPDKLLQEDEGALSSRIRALIKKINIFGKPEEKSSQELGQAEIMWLRQRISARQEGRSDLLRISFRHPDPVAATAFLNELANALVATQADLVQIPGADLFFQQQTKRLEEEAEQASSDLQNFSVAASIYSVADQRTLLLKRGSDLATVMANTRASIEDQRGKKQAIIDQLLILRPVTQSKTVSGIVNELGGRDHGRSVREPSGLDEAPPLLLVRVYQDAMASLLKVNADLTGLLNMEKVITEEIANVNTELAALAYKEAEHNRLKRVLTRAAAAAEHYGSRVIEEQISSDIAKKAQLSSVRVVQTAAIPVEPIFPQISHLVFLALFGGFVLGAAAATMLEMMETSERNREAEQEHDDFPRGRHNVIRAAE
jgi:uncharacterized protein involved in exopolysaccharide biosynthesis